MKNDQQREMPFYEGVEDALKSAVAAMGGAKEVGLLLFPDKPMEEARTLVLNCINPGRKEKFDYTQMIWLFREAKRKGSSSGFQWFAEQCEFEARPISADETKERIVAVIENAAKAMNQGLAALERLKTTA